MEQGRGSRSPGGGAATALLHDSRMMRHRLLWDNPSCAIEMPERLSVTLERLSERGLTDRCLLMQPRNATTEDILLVHSAEYLALVESTQSMSVEELKAVSEKMMDAFFHPDTFACVRLALGATLQLVDAVVSGAVRNGIALVRPPGHHSQRSEANGFCIFNNVAIAAERAKRTHGLRRILIVDWDVHHGQGTQFIFEDDPSVLYFSWHRYEHAKFWPNLRESDFNCVGKGLGAGFNFNLPWNEVGMGNGDYVYAFLHTLLPVAYEFDPELVIVSAGFDSAIGDPEGKMSATPECFAHLTQLLGGLAGGRLCVVLEGGYNLCSLAESVCCTVQTLLGDPVPPLSGRMSPHSSTVGSVHNLLTAQAPYWSCFRLYADSPDPRAEFGADCRDPPWHHRSDLADPSVGLTAAIGTPDFDRLMHDHVASLRMAMPPNRTAVSTSPGEGDGTEAVVAGCATIKPKRLTAEQLLALLRGAALGSASEEGAAAHVCGLLDQVLLGQVQNGAARVPASRGLLACAVNYARHLGAKRTLLLSVGADVPASVLDDGDILVLDVQGGAAEPEEAVRSGERRITISWPEPGSEGELMWTLLHVVLPIAYEFGPDLVLLALGDASDRCQATARPMGHVTVLLQALAAGRVIALVTEAGDPSCSALDSIVRSLQGHPPSPPTLGIPLTPPPSPANLRHLRGAVWALCNHWVMLSGAGSSSPEKQFP